MKRVFALIFVGLALLLPATAPADAEEYKGVVNHVYDPATIRIAYRGGQIRVRLAGLQPPYAENARDTLSRMLLGKQVSVQAIRWEKGFLIGRVFTDGRCVCDGFAEAATSQTPDTPEHDATTTRSHEEA